MPIPEAVLLKLSIMGADIVSDIVLDYVSEKRANGETTITVDELELFAMKFQTLKDTETQKIRDRQNE